MRCAIALLVVLTLAPLSSAQTAPADPEAGLAELPDWPLGYALPAELGGKPPRPTFWSGSLPTPTGSARCC